MPSDDIPWWLAVLLGLVSLIPLYAIVQVLRSTGRQREEASGEGGWRESLQGLGFRWPADTTLGAKLGLFAAAVIGLVGGIYLAIRVGSNR